MKCAVVRTVLLVAWTCATSCWGQGNIHAPLAARTAPTLQISHLRDQVAQLETENSKLKAKLDALTKESPADGQLAGATQQIRQLTDENNALHTSLTEANDTVKQRDEEMNTTKHQLEKALGDLQTTQVLLEQTQKNLQRIIEARERTIEDLQRIIAKTGRPLWPWGVVAAAAALVLGATLARLLWPKLVSRPLSVNVKLGEWVPKAAPKGLTLAPSFGVRSELIPQSSRVCVAREPLVREVRDLQWGVPR